MQEQRVIITCPQCGFSKTVLESAIPPGSKSATCPKCRTAFTFSTADPAGTELPPQETAGGETGAPPLPATPPGNVDAPLSAGVSRPQGPLTLAFSFKGSGSEYFGIWIVNTFLKIITLGFYSA